MTCRMAAVQSWPRRLQLSTNSVQPRLRFTSIDADDCGLSSPLADVGRRPVNVLSVRRLRRSGVLSSVARVYAVAVSSSARPTADGRSTTDVKNMAQTSHTRARLKYPRSGTIMRRELQFEQQSLPHRRQWWRRNINENSCRHRKHSQCALSGSQCEGTVFFWPIIGGLQRLQRTTRAEWGWNRRNQCIPRRDDQSISPPRGLCKSQGLPHLLFPSTSSYDY